MAIFSERYGYTKPSEIIIREQLPLSILNSIINWLNWLNVNLREGEYIQIERNIWQYHFNEKLSLYSSRNAFLVNYFDPINITNQWYDKLDLLELILSLFIKLDIDDYEWIYNESIEHLNTEFERLNYAYRIIDGKIEEITSNEEIQSIEEAINASDNGVKTHLKAALEFLSASNKTPDYRNSIKESISAVEALCRKLTGANDLGKALSQLEKNGITIQPMLKKGIENLYHFTNDKGTGIRHALIEDNYSPNADEAIFMLVTCSAFINFLKKKNGN